jgi:hypothetical protein
MASSISGATVAEKSAADSRSQSPKRVKVFILAGQSNMQGHAEVSTLANKTIKGALEVANEWQTKLGLPVGKHTYVAAYSNHSTHDILQSSRIADGLLQYTDPNVAGSTNAFYRVNVVPEGGLGRVAVGVPPSGGLEKAG